MQVNSEESLRLGLLAHRRFGSWQAIREAVAARQEALQPNGRSSERLTREPEDVAPRQG